MKSFQLARIHLVTVFDARIFLMLKNMFHLLIIYFRAETFAVYSISKIHMLGHFSKLLITIQKCTVIRLKDKVTSHSCLCTINTSQACLC